MHTEPCQKLHDKLRRTGLHLRRWSNTFFSTAKIQLHMALEVILRLDMAMDFRALSPEESDLRRRLKTRVISLAVLERSRKRQCSRITNLKEGDANTRFFHLRVNDRRRKNFIHRLRNGAGWVTQHEEKEKLAQDHFASMLHKGQRRSHDFNWKSMEFTQCNLSSLGDPFMEKEVTDAIAQLPKDKAPGPDGFSVAFFKACWDTIRGDVMAVVNNFSDLRAEHFQ